MAPSSASLTTSSAAMTSVGGALPGRRSRKACQISWRSRRNSTTMSGGVRPCRTRAVARARATARVRQGLTPPDIVVEFRLLRQEIWHALRLRLPGKAPPTDVIAAELVVNDALDGAITMGLTALQERVEEVREAFLATTIHEVRQPLAAIKGQAQLAARAVSGQSPNREWALRSLQKIEASAGR